MCGIKHCLSALLLRPYEINNRTAAHNIESQSWLIKNIEFRTVDQAPGNRSPLCLSGRQLLDPVVDKILQRQNLCNLFNPRLNHILRQSVDVPGNRQQLPRGKSAIQLRIARQIANLPFDLCLISDNPVAIGISDYTLRRLHQTAKHPQQRRLSCTIWT